MISADVVLQGPYRTGKSFLLNQLVRNLGSRVVPDSYNVFAVGNTVQAMTEDVSVFIVPACASPVPGTALLYLDSPGLFAPNRLPIFDAQVLAVLNVLSNVVLFNSLSTLDRSSIEKLSEAVSTAQTLAYFHDPTKGSAPSITHPDLLFVLQAFRLQLRDTSGNTLTPKQVSHADSRRFVDASSHQFLLYPCSCLCLCPYPCRR